MAGQDDEGDGSTTAAGPKNSEEGKTEPTSRKRKWFDYDKTVSRAQRNYSKSEETFESDLKWS
eukprot:10500595-Alexandrium_andersonii.AAC.1